MSLLLYWSILIVHRKAKFSALNLKFTVLCTWFLIYVSYDSQVSHGKAIYLSSGSLQQISSSTQRWIMYNLPLFSFKILLLGIWTLARFLSEKARHPVAMSFLSTVFFFLELTEDLKGRKVNAITVWLSIVGVFVLNKMHIRIEGVTEGGYKFLSPAAVSYILHVCIWFGACDCPWKLRNAPCIQILCSNAVLCYFGISYYVDEFLDICFLSTPSRVFFHTRRLDWCLFVFIIGISCANL